MLSNRHAMIQTGINRFHWVPSSIIISSGLQMIYFDAYAKRYRVQN